MVSQRRSTSDDRAAGRDGVGSSTQVEYDRTSGGGGAAGRRSRRDESRSPRRFSRLRQMRIASLSPTPTFVQDRRHRSRSRVSRTSKRDESRVGRSNSREDGNTTHDGVLANPTPQSQSRSDEVDVEKAQKPYIAKSESDVVSSVFPYPVSHFLGYRRPAEQVAPKHQNVKPFPSIVPSIVHRLPTPLEHILWQFIGAFVGISIVQLVFTRPHHFTSSEDVPPHAWASPIIIGSFGASSVLLYAAPLSPLSQPRPFIGGQFVSALAGVVVTRLFKLAGPTWYDLNETDTAHSLVWLTGSISVALSLCLMTATGTLHPPGGATAVLCATNAQVERLSWRVLPVVLLSSVLMVTWNLIWMNLGRKRYPTSFVAGAPSTAAEGNVLAYLHDLFVKHYKSTARHNHKEHPQHAHEMDEIKRANINNGKTTAWQDEQGWREQRAKVVDAPADDNMETANKAPTERTSQVVSS